MFGDGSANLPVTFIDQHLESTYEDEFILGWEHRFDNDWTIGVTGMWRTLGRVSEDIAIDQAVRAYCADPVNGLLRRSTSCVQHHLGRPAPVRAHQPRRGHDHHPRRQRRHPLDGDTVTLSAEDLGYPKPQRDYYAVTFDFERPWDGQWMLQGSYTWSLSEGNYEGQAKSDNGQDDVGITTDFDLLGLVDGSYGHLPNHRAHQFKVFGAYGVTEAFTVGANIVVQSPREFGCIGRHPTDTDAQDYGASSWYCQGELTPRGTVTESDWLTQVDLSFRYSLPEVVPGDLTLRADIFNIFDEQNVLAIEERGDNSNGSVRNLPAAVTAVVRPTGSRPLTKQLASSAWASPGSSKQRQNRTDLSNGGLRPAVFFLGARPSRRSLSRVRDGRHVHWELMRVCREWAHSQRH